MDATGKGFGFSEDRGEAVTWDADPIGDPIAGGVTKSDLAGVRFTVPGPPLAQPRQRHRVLTIGGKPFAQNYTPAKAPINDFKASVRMAAAAAYNGAPMGGPVELTVLFVFPRPKRLIWKKREMRREFHVSKPDCDNCIKGIKDALNKLLWIDDSQVCDEHIFKRVAAGDEQPHTQVAVRCLESRP